MYNSIKTLLAIGAFGFAASCAEETREGRHSETTGAEARAEARHDDDRVAEQRREEDRRNENRLAEDRRNQERDDDQEYDNEIADDGESLTAQDQNDTESDLRITQAIRSALTGDDSLSMSARNVTVVTEDSVVTLRGSVESADERIKIERHSSVEGVARIDNAIVVNR